MKTPPKLSFACPMPWQKMSGGESRKFCSECGHFVQNLSLLTEAERATVIERARSERICGSYFVRLSGELVTQEKPLSARELSAIKQFGAAVLSASALALASGCVSHPIANTPPGTVLASGGEDEKSKSVGGPEDIVAKDSKKDDQEIVLFTGIICSNTKPMKMHGPHTQ